MKIRIKNEEKGQTLVMLLMFMVIAILVTTASVSLVLNSSIATDKLYQGTNALNLAESGAETAMIKLLRDPLYTGESITVENANGNTNGNINIQKTSSNPYIFISTGTINNFSRKIQITITLQNGVYTITDQRAIF